MLLLFLLPLHSKIPLSLLLLLHMRLLLLRWHLLLHLLLWEELVLLLLEDLLLMQVRGWSESGYSSFAAIPHASSCSSLFFLHLLGVFFPAYEKLLLLGASCRRRKSSHCWSPTQFWPSCSASNTPGRSRGGGQLQSLELQLMTAMYCCCCAYCSSQCTAASGHTVATVHTPPCRGMATRRWMLLRPMYTAH